MKLLLALLVGSQLLFGLMCLFSKLGKRFDPTEANFLMNAGLGFGVVAFVFLLFMLAIGLGRGFLFLVGVKGF